MDHIRRYCLLLVCSLAFQSDPCEAQLNPLVDSLQKVLASSPGDTNKVKLLQRIGREYGSANPRKGIEYGLDAIQLSKKTGWKKGLAVSYILVGFYYNNISSYDTSLVYNDSAIIVAKELQDKSRLALVYINRASIFIETDRLADAQVNFETAMKFANESGNKDRIARANFGLGNVLYYQQQWERALVYYDSALILFREIENKNMEGVALMNLANCKKHLKSLDEAEVFIKQSEAIFLKSNDVNNLILNYGNQAQIYEVKQDTSKAIQYYEKEFALAKEVGDRESMALSGVYLGEHYLKKNRIREAMGYLSDAYLNAKEGGHLGEYYEAAKVLAEGYALQGNHSRSFELLKEALMLKDSLAITRQNDLLIEAQAKFETEKKEQEIALLSKDKLLQEEEVKQQRLLKNIFIGGALVFLLLAFLLFNRYQLKQKAAKQLEAQNKIIEHEKQRAEQSEKFKSQFLANMSHEIRTPMNAVMGFTNLLFDEEDEHKRLQYLTAIKKSSENLLVVINDVLDLSKLEAGKMQLEQVPFHLREVLQFVYESFQLKAQEKSLQWKFNVADELPDAVTGDPSRLTQILFNLVGNAMKFTNHGSVTLTVIESNEGEMPSVSHNPEGSYSLSPEKISPQMLAITFTVNDTGPGIPQNQLERIFESFRQANVSDNRKFGGTGLGLTISKNLVELMGGTISVKSLEGKGSEFSFTIPLQTATDHEFILHHRKDLLFEEDIGEELSGIKILLAEDNEYNRLLVADTLKKFIPGVKIEVFNNGRELVDHLKAIQLSGNTDNTVILMDIQMPEMDGYEATRLIRSELGPLATLPVIALTASVIRSDIEKCIAAGMNSYVAKPFHEKELLIEIAKAVDQPVNERLKNERVYSEEVKSIRDNKGDDNLIDLTFLRNFCKHQPDQFNKYITMFINTMPGMIDKLYGDPGTTDFTASKKILHAMKPQLNSFGLKKALSFIEEMESDNLTYQQVHERISKIITLVSEAVEELKNLPLEIKA